MVGLSSLVTFVFALAGGEGGDILTEDGATVVTGGEVEALSDTLRIEFNVLVCAIFTGAAEVEGLAGGVITGVVTVIAAAGEVCLGEAVAGLDTGWLEGVEACGESFTEGDFTVAVTGGVILTVTDTVAAAVMIVGAGSLTAMEDDVVGGVEWVTASMAAVVVVSMESAPAVSTTG